jgi:hypothetical protein
MKGKTREEYRRQFAAMDLHELLSFAAQLAENHFALLQGAARIPSPSRSPARCLTTSKHARANMRRSGRPGATREARPLPDLDLGRVGRGHVHLRRSRRLGGAALNARGRLVVAIVIMLCAGAAFALGWSGLGVVP